MRLLRTLFLVTLLASAMLATADDEGGYDNKRDDDDESYESYGKKEDYPIDGVSSTATVGTVASAGYRGGPGPGMQEVRACFELSCLG